MVCWVFGCRCDLVGSFMQHGANRPSTVSLDMRLFCSVWCLPVTIPLDFSIPFSIGVDWLPKIWCGASSVAWTVFGVIVSWFVSKHPLPLPSSSSSSHLNKRRDFKRWRFEFFFAEFAESPDFDFASGDTVRRTFIVLLPQCGTTTDFPIDS